MTDWQAEGLLEGLDGDAREARVDLLADLHEAGVPIDELRRAVDEDRLALLPAEYVFRGGASGRYTRREVADKAGLPVELLERQWRALGLPQPDPDDRVFDDRDVKEAIQVKRFLDAGLPEEGVLGVARAIGESMSKVSATIRNLAGEAFLQPGDTELDLGLKYAQAARELSPMVGDTLRYVYDQHMLEGIRSDVVGAAELAAGRLPGAQDIAVAFADLVGFTKLGENLPPEEIGGLAGELADMAAAVAIGPVKLVKTIGDAAMLMAPAGSAAALITAVLDLVGRADDAREGFPQLRAGVACGPALGRGGDWYGRPVNLASRVTGVARPGSVLATEPAHDAAEDAFTWSFAGKRKLKGVKGEQPLFRARPLDPESNGSST